MKFIFNYICVSYILYIVIVCRFINLIILIKFVWFQELDPIEHIYMQSFPGEM